MSKVFSLLLVLSVLTSCTGGGGSAQSQVGGTAQQVEGVVHLGPTNGATVSVYQSNGPDSLFLGTAKSDKEGKYSLTILPGLSAGSKGPVVLTLVASGGTYVSEATGAPTLNDSTIKAMAYLDADSIGPLVVPLTPLSTMAAAFASASHAKSGYDAKQFKSKLLMANQQLATVLGVDVAVVTAIPAPPSTMGSASSASAMAALKIAAFEMAAQSLSQRPADFNQRIANDFSDGVLDGTDDAGNPVVANSLQFAPTLIQHLNKGQQALLALPLFAGFSLPPAAILPFVNPVPPEAPPADAAHPENITLTGPRLCSVQSCDPFGAAGSGGAPGCPTTGLCSASGNTMPAASCDGWQALKTCLKNLCDSSCAIPCMEMLSGGTVACSPDGSPGVCEGFPKGYWQCLCNGDGICNGMETTASCASDCHCGNGICEVGKGETQDSCAADCP